MNKRGTFIAFEGCEGVGKSTQLELLKEYLKETGQHAVFTREPGGTALAEKIRAILLNGSDVSPLVEAYLFAAARAEHIKEVVLPALERGETVITDRFVLSSLAYQGKARGLGYETVLEINRIAMQGVNPDITIFLDMKPSVSWRKQKGAVIEGDRMEQEGENFHNLVYVGFKEAQKKDGNIVSIYPSLEKTDTLNSILEVLKGRGYVR